MSEKKADYKVGNCKPDPEKRFQKGHPGYKKKGTVHLKTILKRLLARPLEYKDLAERKVVQGVVYDAVAETVIIKALKGDLKAAAIIFDRMEGKPDQKMTIESDNKEEEIVNNINKMPVEKQVALLEELEKLDASESNT